MPAMIVFDDGGMRFQYRVGGVARRDGHLLTARGDGAGYPFLPGGRVEVGETASAALVREMREELGLEISPGRLLWVVEALFTLDARPCHEISLLFEMELPAGSLPLGAVHRDPVDRIALSWQPLAAIATSGLRPAFLRTEMAVLPPTPRHIVLRE